MLKRALGLAVAVSLAACGSPARIQVDQAVIQQVKESKVFSAVWQDEVIIRARSEGGSAGPFGLIGAVIMVAAESSSAAKRQATIQTVVEPFYLATEDVDMRSLMAQSLAAGLNTKVQPTPVTLSQKEKKELPKSIKSDAAVTYYTTNYSLSDDMSQLLVQTHAVSYRGGVDKPIYANDFTYVSERVGQGGKDSLDAWSANKGEAYRKMLSEGVAEIVRMAAMDSKATNEDGKPLTFFSIGYTTENPYGVLKLKGKLLEDKGQRIIARDDKDGKLHSVVRYN